MLQKKVAYVRTYPDRQGDSESFLIFASANLETRLATATICSATEPPAGFQREHVVPIQNGETGAMAQALAHLNGLCPTRHGWRRI